MHYDKRQSYNRLSVISATMRECRQKLIVLSWSYPKCNKYQNRNGDLEKGLGESHHAEPNPKLSRSR